MAEVRVKPPEQIAWKVENSVFETFRLQSRSLILSNRRRKQSKYGIENYFDFEMTKLWHVETKLYTRGFNLRNELLLLFKFCGDHIWCRSHLVIFKLTASKFNISERNRISVGTWYQKSMRINWGDRKNLPKCNLAGVWWRGGVDFTSTISRVCTHMEMHIFCFLPLGTCPVIKMSIPKISLFYIVIFLLILG